MEIDQKITDNQIKGKPIFEFLICCKSHRDYANLKPKMDLWKVKSICDLIM